MKKQLFFIAMLAIIGMSANAQWQYTNLPISTGQVTSIASNGSNIFAGHKDGGVFLSTNSGSSWTAVNSGLTNTIVNALAISGNNIFAGTNGGVFLSVNNGNSWNNVSTGLTNDSVMSLAICGNNIFAGTCWSGVFRSSDNGNTWIDVNNSLTDTAEILSFLVDGNNIFAGTADGGVFMTTNNGSTWTSTGLTNNTVYSLAKSGNNISASTWSNGIYLSSDNGNTWSTINNGLTDIHILSLVTIGKYIFAGNAFSGDVFLSSDNGNSWSSTGLTSSSSIYTLNIVENSIFAGIGGGTIWKRPLSEMICLAQFTMVPDTTILHHYYVINNALGTPPLSYLWSWGDGTYDTIAYPTHTYSAAGNYNICLTISDFTGCTSTYCDSSYLQKSPNTIISVDVVPPIGTGVNEFSDSPDFSVFPNPTTYNLTFNCQQKAIIEILNIQGQTISQQTLHQGKTDIDVSDFSNGVYIIKATTDRGVTTKKFIKE